MSSFAGSEEVGCHVVKGTVSALQELRAALAHTQPKQRPQFHNLKEMNSATSHMSLEKDPEECSTADTLLVAL